MIMSCLEDGPPLVAIVGGGIVGLILAIGLHKRSIRVAVYEQASSFRESGAGIGFNRAAKACMEMIDPAVLSALRQCGSVSVSGAGDDDDGDQHDYLRWADGYSQQLDGHAEVAPGGWQRLYLQADAGYRGIEGTRRDHFLDALGAILPSDQVHFNRRLHSLQGGEGTTRITLTFDDKTTTTADVVIGCDGIRSRVRESVLGPSSSPSPSCAPTYSQIRAYRALLPMTAAAQALGAATASVYHNHIGPGANIITYPVACGTLINVAVFLHDVEATATANDVAWTARDAPRSDIDMALHDWHPRIRRLVQLLPERLPMLRVFDLHDHPLAHYHRGRIGVAGDAAHASSPHHGAGAGMGVEDALCLCTLLAEVHADIRERRRSSWAMALEAALQTYDSVRRERSQWLVTSSRRVCELQHSSDSRHPTRFQEILDRTLHIWNFDPVHMIRQTTDMYSRTRD